MKNLIPFSGAYKLILQALNVLIISLFFLSFTSCRTQRQVQYLQGNIDTAALSQISIPEPIIQKGDIIGITIFSDNFAESAIFNQGSGAVSSSQTNNSGVASNALTGSAGQAMPAYLVDLEGNIHFQTIGIIKVEGLTKKQLSKILQEQLSKYLKDPYCNIRFLNYKFTVLGEVTRQGVFTVYGDNITIIEALGMAGDMTIYGKKDSLLVMREFEGKRTFGYVDVSQPNVIKSPFYYLKQNDVIFVRSDPKKPTASDQNSTRNLTTIATISAIITSLSLLLFNILN